MSIKIQRVFIILVAATLLMFICLGATVTAYAETPEAKQTEYLENELVAPETEANGETDAPDVEELAERFKAYLMGKYGNDYEYYYNRIIEQWGSIEGYLLAFGDKLPEERQSGWDRFVAWLDEYASVWAPILAVAVIIIIAVVGKKVFNGVIERIVNAKLYPVVKELNLQSNATTALLHSQKTLLGTSDKFKDTVKELEKADKELNNG